MAAKKDPLKEKEARQKKIAIVGGVILLGVMAFQVPRTMKMLHGTSTDTTAASTTSASTTPGSTPLAPPSLDGSAAATASAGTGASAGATSADGVVDASSPLPASSGQLVSFSRFKTKDPFVQQVQDCTGGCSASTPASGGAAAGSAGSSGAAAPVGSSLPTTSVTGNLGSGSSSGGATASAAKNPTTASISVNGTVSRVAVGKTFPTADPVFVVVAVTAKEAKISIAGGSIQGGAPTVSLPLGKTVKLQNTADGAMYVLRLAGTA